MAKNLFEQLLTKASEIWSGPKTYSDHDIYIKDTSGLSSVAKYLARQEEALKAKAAETMAAQATGVEKYLARQQSSSTETAQHTPSTKVDKYLARKTSGGAVPAPKETIVAPATGVGKYLSRQASPGAAAPTPPKEPVIIPKTGVGKYLAGIAISRETIAAPAPEKKQPAQSKPEPKKASAKKPASVTTAKEVATAAATKAPEAVTTETTSAASTAHDVIHFENVTQCQSRTTKGTQCKNTNHLTKLQRTINKQKYQFSACPQHHNDTFKPYPPLLETH